MNGSTRIKNKTLLVARCAMTVALAFVLSNIKLYTMPQGGSVTLVALPLLVVSAAYGPAAGAASGAVLGVLKMFTSGHFYGWTQALLDYPAAYCSLALCGVAAVEGDAPAHSGKLMIAASIALLIKLSIHVYSGYLFFDKSLGASLTYNAMYGLPETALTLAAMYALNRRGVINRL